MLCRINRKKPFFMKLRIERLFFVLIFWLTLFSIQICSTQGFAEEKESRILFISSYHPSFPTFFKQIDGIKSSLNKLKMVFDVEFMDCKRFDTEKNIELFLNRLTYKLKNSAPYDIVFLGDDNALKFALENQKELFKGIPLVFLGVNNVELALAQNLNPMVTGVVEAVSMKETFELILKLHPETKSIVAIVDSTLSGTADLKTFYKEAGKFNTVRFSDLSLEKLSFLELSSALPKMEKNTVILLLSAYFDKDGKPSDFYESLKLISTSTSVPIYHLWEHGVGDGILGGKVTYHYLQGRAAGKIAFDILKGKPISDIGVNTESPNQFLFDFNQLKRFNINLDKLPESSKIVNQPPTFYSINKRTIHRAIFAILLLSIASAFLLWSLLKIKNTEKRLRENESFLHNIVENIPSMIFVKDANNLKLVRVNKTGEELLGIDRENLIGKSDFDLFPPEQAKFFAKMDHLVVEGKTLIDIPEEEIQTRNSGKRILHTKKLPVFSENGEPVYLLGISEDITETKQDQKNRLLLEAQLWQAQKMQAVGNLAGGIAHDFNNILTAILGYGEMVLDDLEPESDLWEKQKEVIMGAKRAKGLVRQILSFSRQEKSEKKELNLHVIVEEALKLMRASIPTTIDVVKKLSEEESYIFADPTQIHQVVMNICTNAYHSMKQQGGTITVELKPNQMIPADLNLEIDNPEKQKFVILKIQDTGCGFDDELKERIFEPYFSTKEKGEGTGIGLAVVHSIVCDCGGKIVADSQKNVGSTFSIFFPQIEPKSVVKPNDYKDGLPTGKEKILVVDDEEHIVKLLKHLLENLGYTVTTASGAEEALVLFKSSPESFDLILTDMTMPNLTGAELSKRVLEISPETPIIMCTGYSDIIDRDKALEIGIKEFILKPFTCSELSKIIRKVLDS